MHLHKHYRTQTLLSIPLLQRAPTLLALNTPSASPEATRPSVDVTYVDAGPGTGTVTLYSDATCTAPNAISDATAYAASPMEIEVNAANALADAASYTIRAQVTDQAGNIGPWFWCNKCLLYI